MNPEKRRLKRKAKARQIKSAGGYLHLELTAEGKALVKEHRWDHDGEHMWWLCGGCSEPQS